MYFRTCVISFNLLAMSHTALKVLRKKHDLKRFHVLYFLSSQEVLLERLLFVLYEGQSARKQTQTPFFYLTMRIWWDKMIVHLGNPTVRALSWSETETCVTCLKNRPQNWFR